MVCISAQFDELMTLIIAQPQSDTIKQVNKKADGEALRFPDPNAMPR
jgi:hypothetical protein